MSTSQFVDLSNHSHSIACTHIAIFPHFWMSKLTCDFLFSQLTATKNDNLGSRLDTELRIRNPNHHSIPAS